MAASIDCEAAARPQCPQCHNSHVHSVTTHVRELKLEGKLLTCRHSASSCPMIRSADDSEITRKIKNDDVSVHRGDRQFCLFVWVGAWVAIWGRLLVGHYIVPRTVSQLFTCELITLIVSVGTGVEKISMYDPSLCNRVRLTKRSIPRTN